MSSLYAAKVSGEPRPIVPTRWEMDYRERLSKRLLSAFEGAENDNGKKIEPMREYDRGVEGFVDFCQDILTVTGEDGIRRPMVIWTKQRELAKLILENPRTACISGHSIGKSYFAAAFCLWWFCCRGLNFHTTAPRMDHVKEVIWKNIKSLIEGANRELPCRWYPSPRLQVKGNAKWYATGYSIGDTAESGAGYHDVAQLIVGDEAAGLNKKHEASFRSSMASRDTRLLLIGNGNKDRNTLFRKAFEDREVKKQWATLQISSWDSPNVTGECTIDGLATKEWCEQQKAELRDDPDEYKCKVLGEWPQDDTASKIIPYDYVKEAIKLWKELAEEELNYLHPPRITKVFVDVAEGGPDRSVMAYLRGQRAFIHKVWSGGGHLHQMNVADDVADWCRKLDEKPDQIAIDISGGPGVFSRLCQLKEQNPHWFGECVIVGFKGAKLAHQSSEFNNVTTEIYWTFRRRLDPTLPYHERVAVPPYGPEGSGISASDIIDELTVRHYDKDDLGRKAVESKKSLKKRGVKSPDVADALVGLMVRPHVPVTGFFV